MHGLEVVLGRLELRADLSLGDVVLGSIGPDLVIGDADSWSVEIQLGSVDLHASLAHTVTDLRSFSTEVASVVARGQLGAIDVQVGPGSLDLVVNLRLVRVELDMRLSILEGTVLVVGARWGRERGATAADAGAVAVDAGVDAGAEPGRPLADARTVIADPGVNAAAEVGVPVAVADAAALGAVTSIAAGVEVEVVLAEAGLVSGAEAISSELVPAAATIAA